MKITVPTFEPKKGVSIVTDEKASNLSSTSVDDVAVIDDLLTKVQEYAKRLPPGFQMKPIQFEKVIFSNIESASPEFKKDSGLRKSLI